MIRVWVLLFSLLAPFEASAHVSFTWLGTTGTYITDGTTAILIDPVVSRPSLWEILLSRPLTTDKEQVKAAIQKLEIKNVQAVLITHSHHDHAMDSPEFTKLTSSVLTGSNSTANIGRGGGLPEKQIRVVQYGDVISFGKFKVTFLKAIHSPIVFNYQMFSGEIEKPLVQPAAAKDYKMGGSYSFLIEHPDGMIYFHPASRVGTDEIQKKADVLFQGIASRISDQDIVDKIVTPVSPKILIPLHFDDFFSPVGDRLKTLFGVNLPGFLAAMKTRASGVQTIVPKYGERVELFK